MRKVVKKSLVPNVMPKDQWTKGTRSKLLGKDNAAEEHVKGLLADGGIHYHRERPFDVNGKRYFVDFHAMSLREGRKRLRVSIEVDGGYHFTPEQQEADRRKDADLLKCSRVWSILRVKSEAALRMNSTQLLDHLTSMKMGEVRFVG